MRSIAKGSQHPQLLTILHKWSSKINAATSALPSSSSKFLQGTKGQTGVVEAIEAGIANRVGQSPKAGLQ